MSEKNDRMTAGDIAGEAAKKAGVRLVEKTVAESGKPKTRRDMKIAEWKGKYAIAWNAACVFAFIEKNPGVALEVVDTRSPKGEKGVLFKRNDDLSIRFGNRVYSLPSRNDEFRFMWTDGSAELLGDFEYKRDIAEVEMSRIAETRGFINSSSTSAIEGKEERNRSGFSSLLKSIMCKGDVAYAVHDREKLDSIYYKCSESEAQSLKEMARQGCLPIYQESGVTEVVIYKDLREAEFVEILKNSGFTDKTCLPVKLKIDKAGVQFYPFYQVVV